MADFVGDMSVEIVSGNFKANSVTGGEFSVKQNKGEFEVEKLGNMTAEFKSCKVKIGEGKEMKLDCTRGFYYRTGAGRGRRLSDLTGNEGRKGNFVISA